MNVHTIRPKISSYMLTQLISCMSLEGKSDYRKIQGLKTPFRFQHAERLYQTPTAKILME